MDKGAPRTGKLLSKPSHVEVVADQGADGSYEIRVERASGEPDVVPTNLRAEPVHAAPRSMKGLWIGGAAVLAAGAAVALLSRGGASDASRAVPQAVEKRSLEAPSVGAGAAAPVTPPPEVVEPAEVVVAPPDTGVEPNLPPPLIEGIGTNPLPEVGGGIGAAVPLSAQRALQAAPVVVEPPVRVEPYRPEPSVEEPSVEEPAVEQPAEEELAPEEGFEGEEPGEPGEEYEGEAPEGGQ
jgi:hypothetical protein